MNSNYSTPINAIRDKEFAKAAELIEKGVGLADKDAGGRDIVGCARHYAESESQVLTIRKAVTTALTIKARSGASEEYAHLAHHAVPKQKTSVNGVPHTLGTAATIAGQAQTLKGWLKAGGNPNSSTPIGMTLTGQAVAMNREDMAQILSEANASLKLKDKLGMSPLSYALAALKEGVDKCLAVFSGREEANAVLAHPELKGQDSGMRR
jgi:ankyrin repeat protein